jgi:histidinol-phosphate/aromatic aminotransferase/cobyric acid decarboxylase-like protein
MFPARINASSVTNPYADPNRPRDAAPLDVVAQHTQAPTNRIAVTTGARHALRGLITGPVLLNLPTSPAYVDLARVPVIVHQLDARHDFALDLKGLERKITRFNPQTVLLASPNNPDGGAITPAALERFLATTKARHVIVDETFAPFAGRPSLAPLVEDFANLTVVGSLRPSHAIDVGYVIARTPPRSRPHQPFCARPDEHALRTYIREARAFHANLALLPGSKTFPSAANFALMSTYRPAKDVIRELAEHGIDVRDCADQWVLNATRYLRLTARTAEENEQILRALHAVLTVPLALAS